MSLDRFRCAPYALTAAVWFVPALASAQSTPLAFILPELLGNTITLAPSDLPDQPNHVAHFRPEFDQLVVPSQVNQALLTLMSTYPIGTPSGGFTYTIDPALGTLMRSSESFGPSFAERALTSGRGKVSVGFGYQHAAYDTFEGLNLRQRGPDGITFYIPHTDCCSRGTAQESQPDGSRLSPPFEGDLIQAQVALRMATDQSIIFANYGLFERLDIGVAVPFVRVELDASMLATIQRLSTETEPDVHVFEGGNPDQRLFQLGGTASGLGDIMLRAKYAFTQRRTVGLAAAIETRLPTGDETNLLGTGGVQTRIFGIASLNRGRFSPHVNVGYTFSTDGSIPGATLRDEISTAVGFDVAVNPRLTMSLDVLGRTLIDAGRMRLTEKVYEYALAGGGSGGGGGGGGGGRPTTPTVEIRQTTRTELQFEPGDLQLYIGAAGIRFSPWRTLLVSANLLFPLTNAGLRDRVTPVIGVDYVF
jgi:hypothetical protein